MAVNEVQPTSQRSDNLAFVSLGMIVLDERRYPSREPLYDIPGGSGLYATLGARLVQTNSDPSRIGCVILAGYDFPESLLGQIQAWGLTMQVKKFCDKPSTRGLLEYQDDDFGLDIFSPNHLELESLVRGTRDTHPFSRQAIEDDARYFFDAGVGHDGEGIVVVRCGEHGCMILSRSQLEAEWFPAFYELGSPKIIDTTGAGNAFLGGFSAGLQTTRNPRDAAILGSVAASFTLEQVGLPKFTPASWPDAEKWNDTEVSMRILEFKNRMNTM
ncbi:hypothetical protein ACHAPJ_005914 [Fusarium lateritium]